MLFLSRERSRQNPPALPLPTIIFLVPLPEARFQDMCLAKVLGACSLFYLFDTNTVVNRLGSFSLGHTDKFWLIFLPRLPS